MQATNETLRYRRTHVLLKNARYFWVGSIVLSLMCLAIVLMAGATSAFFPLMTVASAAVSALGLWFTHYSQARFSKDPLWSPIPTFVGFTTSTGVLWGLQAGNGGLCLTLAIAMSGLAGTFLFSHGRLAGTVAVSIAAIPIPLLYFAGDPLLGQVHIPLMALILFGSYVGHRTGLGNIRKGLEAQRLNQLLTVNQAELQTILKERAQELEQSNKRLELEVQLRKEVNKALILSEEHLNLAMTASGVGFWDWDVKSRKAYHSDTTLFFGRKDSLSNDDFDVTQFVIPEDATMVRKALAQHLKGGSELYRVRYRVRLPESNDIRWLEDIGKITERDSKGRAARMLGTRRDVSSDMQLQEELRLSSSLFNNSTDGVFVLDEHQHFRTCNREFCQIFGRQKGELLDLPLFQVIQTNEEQSISKGMINNGRWSGEIYIRDHNGQRFSISLTLTTVLRDDGSVSHYLGICREQTGNLLGEKTSSKQNSYDKLTGLYNRNHFQQILRQFNDHKPLKANHYAVCVINLDRFKSINESFGQDVGDQLLKDLAARLSNLSDPIRQVARLASDEFALIVEFEDDRNQLTGILEHLQACLNRPFLIDDHELIMTASMGVCIVNESNIMNLLNYAITAMNQARYQGGNNVQYYHQKLATTPLERQQLEKALRKAISNQEFSVDYQPKMNLRTGMIDSVEALVRWMHPHMGIVDPVEFLPLAEETGLIYAIGNQVLNKACQEAAAWRARGFGNIALSVNLSSRQIRRDDLYDIVHDALHSSDLPAEFLELEITEGMLMEDVNHAEDFLNQLRSLGVRIALDDFGTGYSSLANLKRLPIDTVKIDHSFIAEARDGRTSPVVEAIMAMSESLDLSVVAEGVETQEQLDYLKKLGCDYAQGFLISRPLPASEVLSLIRHSNLGIMSSENTAVH